MKGKLIRNGIFIETEKQFMQRKREKIIKNGVILTMFIGVVSAFISYLDR